MPRRDIKGIFGGPPLLASKIRERNGEEVSKVEIRIILMLGVYTSIVTVTFTLWEMLKLRYGLISFEKPRLLPTVGDNKTVKSLTMPK
jgi:hypothetical protein